MSSSAWYKFGGSFFPVAEGIFTMTKVVKTPAEAIIEALKNVTNTVEVATLGNLLLKFPVSSVDVKPLLQAWDQAAKDWGYDRSPCNDLYERVSGRILAQV